MKLLIDSWVDDKHKANSVCLDDGSSLVNNEAGSDNGNTEEIEE